jgi:MoaA/NifB/PqqE/SkfB family radical SAM enzyme
VSDVGVHPVELRRDRARRSLPDAAPPGYDERGPAERALRAARLAAFFGRLAVKEHVRPRLHVRPLVAELFLTENCNLRCVSCACWTTTTRDELRTEEWCSVIDQLVEGRILKVNFTGGEPLIRRDAVGLIAYAAHAGVRDIHLNTNAIRLDAAMLDRVLAAGVRSFNISVDGPDATTHDAIRGVDGAFETTVAHLRGVLARRDELGLSVRMNFTVMASNVAMLPGIARLAQELGVRLYLNLATDSTFLFREEQVSAEAAVDAAALQSALAEVEDLRGADRRWLPSTTDLGYVRAHFGDRLQGDLPCAESQLKLMVHSTGGVGGCWGHDPTMNVRERSIASIIDSAAYRDEHERFYRKECVGCGSNYSLNLRWRPTTLVADAVGGMRGRWDARRRDRRHGEGGRR